MSSRKIKPAAVPRRDTFEMKAWPLSVKGEGWGLPVAVLSLIVIVAMMSAGVAKLADALSNITVHVVQEPAAPPEKPPPDKPSR